MLNVPQFEFNISLRHDLPVPARLAAIRLALLKLAPDAAQSQRIGEVANPRDVRELDPVVLQKIAEFRPPSRQKRQPARPAIVVASIPGAGLFQ